MVHFHRPHFHTPSPASSWSQLDIRQSVDGMSIASSSTSSRPRTRDTGFPEPFCGNRNTTLPHPDADTSPNACISQDDISVSRLHSRHRRSFFAKHKRINSHGVIAPDVQAYNENNVSLVMSDSDSPGLSSAQMGTIPGTPDVGHSLRPRSKGDGESLASSSTGDNHNGSPKSPTNRHTPFRRRLSSDTNDGRSVKGRSLISKLGIHRHHHN